MRWFLMRCRLIFPHPNDFSTRNLASTFGGGIFFRFLYEFGSSRLVEDGFRYIFFVKIRPTKFEFRAERLIYNESFYPAPTTNSAFFKLVKINSQ